jgi:hypothetical protein
LKINYTYKNYDVDGVSSISKNMQQLRVKDVNDKANLRNLPAKEHGIEDTFENLFNGKAMISWEQMVIRSKAWKLAEGIDGKC